MDFVNLKAWFALPLFYLAIFGFNKLKSLQLIYMTNWNGIIATVKMCGIAISISKIIDCLYPFFN